VLRTAVAHVVAATVVAWVVRLGSVEVEVECPPPPPPPSGSGGAGGGARFTVEVGGEARSARCVGVLLARLNGGALEEEGPGGVHPLVRAVEARVRGCEVRRREDGVVEWCLDVEHLQ